MKVLKITENKDGSALIDYEITDKDKEIIKQLLKVKKLTNKRINEFVLKGFKQYLKELGG